MHTNVANKTAHEEVQGPTKPLPLIKGRYGYSPEDPRNTVIDPKPEGTESYNTYNESPIEKHGVPYKLVVFKMARCSHEKKPSTFRTDSTRNPVDVLKKVEIPKETLDRTETVPDPYTFHTCAKVHDLDDPEHTCLATVETPFPVEVKGRATPSEILGAPVDIVKSCDASDSPVRDSPVVSRDTHVFPPHNNEDLEIITKNPGVHAK